MALCLAAVDGQLGKAKADWDPRASLGLVIAAEGYPGSYPTGHRIEGLDAPLGPDATVFHAGTRMEHDRVVSSGGRVLCAVALGETVTAARRRAYDVAEMIDFDGAFYRGDIGYRAVAREATDT